MTDDLEHPSRTSLLAAFARSPEKTSESQMVVMSPPSPIDRFVGAQKVAVYRDEQKVLEKLKILGAAAGSAWMYRFPVKTKGGGTDWIEGPSIKLANDIARLYGNCEIDVRVTDLGDSWLIYAKFFDAETGFTMTRPFQQRKGQRGMRTESERALDIALQIGVSKAIRNVIVNSLQSIADFALEEARNALVDKVGKNLEGYRGRAVDRLKQMAVDLPRVEHVIGRAAAKWTAPDVARVIAMIQSINDGMTTIDDAFPPTAEEASSTVTKLSPDQIAGTSRNVAQSAASEAPASQDAGPAQQARIGTDASQASSADEQAGPASGEPPDSLAAKINTVVKEANRTPPTDPLAVMPPGAKPPADPLIRAYARGQHDRSVGLARKAVPLEYRAQDRAAEALAWAKGWIGEVMDWPTPPTGPAAA